MYALDLFKKLPHLNDNKEVIVDWGYTPNLYHFDTKWHVEIGQYVLPIENVKPYLLPLSSMTEEQKKELNDKLIELEFQVLNDEISHIETVKFEIDYYLKNRLDYRGLIEKTLALDATGLNIY